MTGFARVLQMEADDRQRDRLRSLKLIREIEKRAQEANVESDPTPPADPGDSAMCAVARHFELLAADLRELTGIPRVTFEGELARGGVVQLDPLVVGEVVEEDDLYLSTSGRWEKAPIWGHEIEGYGVQWARLRWF